MATLKNLTIADTGALQLPAGTTGQRGASGETSVTFSTVGTTTWTAPSNVTSIRLLIVGGGGGGGGDVGGGGGAGGLLYYGNYAITPGNVYTVVVGGGGSGGTNQPTQGGNSSFNGVVAYGGGYAGFWSAGQGQSGSTIGSAGGNTSNVSQQLTTSSGQGNNGGVPGNNTSPSSSEYAGASGGGGAGAQGGDGIPYNTGVGNWWGLGNSGYKFFGPGGTNGSTKYAYGGDGMAFDISGSVLYYAGGGGGSSDNQSYAGYGGKGGGGNGGPTGSNNASYYGGGGGGAGSPNTGGSGYQGVVIVAYNTVGGEMRYNTTTGLVEHLGNGTWDTLGKQVNASGGTVSTSGGYTVRTFTSPGTFTLNQPGTIEALVVAGGGGGCDISGGGGGGGFIYQSRKRLSAGVYPITIGTGGTGSSNWYNDTGTPGNPSIFADIEAIGGGAGAHYNYPPSNPAVTDGAYPGWQSDGGSGGGGPGGHYFPGLGGVHGNPGNTRGQVAVQYGGTGVVGQGHPGGTGTHGHGWGAVNHPTNGLCYAGGGGGGAGSKGSSVKDRDSNTVGGRGLASSISGSPTHYAGGGGGGIHQPGGQGHYGVAFSAGGVGGGGAAGGPGTPGVTGTTNTGGGGGGGHHSGPDQAGGGGPGIVVIRHL